MGKRYEVLRKTNLIATATTQRVFFQSLRDGRLIVCTAIDRTGPYTVAAELFDSGAGENDLDNYTAIMSHEQENNDANVVMHCDIPVKAYQSLRFTFTDIQIGDALDVTALIEVDY